MIVKPWREVAVPHEDVLKGTFQQSEFAADISRVHSGTAEPAYQDAKLFFERTYITEGMRLLLDSVLKRLAGCGGEPVIQLQTAFGGGKTHTLLAVYHIASAAVPARKLLGVPAILDAAGIKTLPQSRVVVLDGINFSPNKPTDRGNIKTRTLLGDLAWQLGGEEAYAAVKEADVSGTSLKKEELAALLNRYAPCTILMDEMVAYLRQFEESQRFTGGTFDSNQTFFQALTEAMKAVPQGVILASLPESSPTGLNAQVGSTIGLKALRTLEDAFGRVQALWKPVAAEEAFEIVRRRLFASMTDQKAVDAVCRAFADFYVANGAHLPQETQESRYYERLKAAYPIHPEVFDRLYADWSTLDNFQRTRGVLKLLAKVIHRLWKDGNNDLMIMPGSLPLYDADTRNEVIYYLPPGWDPVLERDIDGDRAETTEIESQDTRLGSVQGCRRVARTVFLGSAPTTTGQLVRGIDAPRVILGCAQPDQQISVFEDSLKRLSDRLHYLNHANDRFWFDTRPNLRREMEERKKRFNDKDDIYPIIREQLQKSLVAGAFGGVHVFTSSADIPDDWTLRLVVLSPEGTYRKTEGGAAIDQAAEILRNRGDQPRQKQNRLLFLAGDADSIGRLKDQVRSMLAWQSIVADIRELKLNLDQLQARQAAKSLEEASAVLRRMAAETYRWLLAPMQEVRPGKSISEVLWETFPLNPSAHDMSQDIGRVLKENEVLITEWAPIHLAALLKTWFWKQEIPDAGAQEVWQKTCCYLYLPRLRDESVFRAALATGTGSRDFFGIAQGKEEGKYVGFSLGETVSPILDASLLLIEPKEAVVFAERLRARDEASRAGGGAASPSTGPGGGAGEISDAPRERVTAGVAGGGAARRSMRRFYGTIELDAFQAKKQFSDVVDEILLPFTSRPGVKVKIVVDIQAELSAGFDQDVQRTVKENCNTMKFKGAEFEEGE